MSSDQKSFEALTKAIAQRVAQFTDQRKTTLDGEVIAAAMMSNAAALWAHNPVSRTRHGRREILREVSKLFDNQVKAGRKRIDKGLAPSPGWSSSHVERVEPQGNRFRLPPTAEQHLEVCGLCQRISRPWEVASARHLPRRASQ